MSYPPVQKWIIHLKCVIVSCDDDTCERVQWESHQILFAVKFTLHISEQNKNMFDSTLSKTNRTTYGYILL